MATQDDKLTVSLEELLLSNLAQSDAIVELLIEKGLATRDEILRKVSAQRTVYQRMLNPSRQ